MEGSRLKLLVALTFVLPFASPLDGNARQPLKRHWTETASETLWTVRYNNCDYGYYVSLPNGVVGHNTLPPSPNHGFRIALPDVGTTNYVLDRNDRFIWVDASYNASDADSLPDLVAEQDRVSRKQSLTQTKMAGLSAVQTRSAHGVGATNVVEVTTLALRANIIYTIGMRTNRADAVADEAEYSRVIHSFNLLPLPRGHCSNG